MKSAEVLQIQVDILAALVKLHEERIIALELKLDRSRDPNPPDGYYFDY